MTTGMSAEVQTADQPVFHDPRLNEEDLNVLDDLGDYRVDYDDEDEPLLLDQHGNVVETWRENYPYPERMSREQYDREKRQLQIELLKLQNWIKETGRKLVILFEGRDAAGKGGTIKRFTEHLNPRGATRRGAGEAQRARVDPVVLPALHRRTCRPPARSCCSTGPGTTGPASSGSWASAPARSTWSSCARRRNWSGCWCAPASTWSSSGSRCPATSSAPGSRSARSIRCGSGSSPRWISPSLDKWDAYTEAKEAMFFYTDTADAPWIVVKSNDKKRARLEAMRYVLGLFDYDGKDAEIAVAPDPKIVGRGLEEIDDSPSAISTFPRFWDASRP